MPQELKIGLSNEENEEKIMYDNTNRGFLRKNDKAKTEKSPNYTGSINVEGQEYWVSGWLAEHENMGGKYFRLSLKNKDAPYKPDEQSVPEKKFDDAPYKPDEQSVPEKKFDDDIPF